MRGDAEKYIEFCRLRDIPDGGSKEFTVAGEALFAVRQNDRVHLYRNSCPHTGLPLNWQPDHFMCPDRRFIQCSVHAAIFEPDTGRCVAGPCIGDSLNAVDCDVREDKVYIPASLPALNGCFTPSRLGG